MRRNACLLLTEEGSEEGKEFSFRRRRDFEGSQRVLQEELKLGHEIRKEKSATATMALFYFFAFLKPRWGASRPEEGRATSRVILWARNLS